MVLHEDILMNTIMSFKYIDEGAVNTEDSKGIEYNKGQLVNFKTDYFNFKETEYNLQRKLLQLFMYHRLYYDVLKYLDDQYLPLLSDINYDNNYINIFDIFNYDITTRDDELVNKNKAYESIDDNRYKYMNSVINKIFDYDTKTKSYNDYYDKENII